MEDTLSIMGTFLTNKEVFMAATVNKEWKKSQQFNKKKIIKKAKQETFLCHMCNNMCPCALERYYKTLINDFKLKRYICASLNSNEEPPQWLHPYLD